MYTIFFCLSFFLLTRPSPTHPHTHTHTQVRRIRGYVRRKVTRKYIRGLFRKVLPNIIPKIWWQRRRAADILVRSTKRFLFYRSRRLKREQEQREQAAAQNLQRLWRSMLARARLRLNARARDMQKREEFRDCVNVTSVLRIFQEHKKRIYDPCDASVGLNLLAFMRRTGAICAYEALTDSTRLHTIRTFETFSFFFFSLFTYPLTHAHHTHTLRYSSRSCKFVCTHT